MISREERVEKLVSDKLSKLELFPFSVTCTFCIEESGLLSMTFHTNIQLHNFLKNIDYESKCNKNDIIIFDSSNTVILTGLALIEFCQK